MELELSAPPAVSPCVRVAAAARFSAAVARRVVVALALLLAVQASVGAQPLPFELPETGTADEAETAFVLGNEAFIANDHRRALGYYFVSNRLAPNKNVAFNIARCYEALGDWVEAYRYFQEHALAPGAPDGNSVQSRDALVRLASKVALVEVRSTPPGAAVYIDRKELGLFGKTPRRVPVAPGTHTFIVEHPGYQPFESQPVLATTGTMKTVEALLLPVTATLDISGGPAGAKVSWLVTGQAGVVGTMPVTLVVPAGSHRLKVESPGYETREIDISLSPSERRAVVVELEAEVGTLLVNGDESGAIIRLDGVPVGFTPTVLDRVPVGRHRLEVAAEGFAPYDTEVVVVHRERREVFAQLSVASEVEAASRARESIADAPASVSVITSYELRMLGMVTLGDALAGQRGTYITNDYSYPSASFRGVGPLGDFGNRVQVQLDGHVMNYLYDGSSSIDLDLLVGLQGLERVEIVRGPGSALYGSGALFGALNLVTPRDFSDRKGRVGVSGLGPSSGRLWADYTTPFGERGRFWTYAGLLYTQPHSFFSPGRVGSEDFPDGTARNVGETTAGTSMGTVGWGPLTLAWYFNERDLASPAAPFGSAFGSPDNELLDRRAFMELRYEAPITDKIDLSARLALDHSFYNGVYPYDRDNEDVYVERFWDWSLSTEGRVHIRVNDQIGVLAGLLLDGAADNRMRGHTQGERELTLDVSHPILKVAAYSTVEWQYKPELTFHGGLRFDGVSVLGGRNNNITGDPDYVGFEGSLSPRLAAVWRAARDSTLKFVAGSAFRAPTFYELTYGDGGTTQVPPKGLEPERIWTTEVELGQRLAPDLVLNVGGYLSSVQDSVTVTGDGTSEDPLVYANRKNPVSSMGLELEIVHELRRGLTFGLTYALQRSRLGGLFSGESLENSPTHLVGGRAIIPVITKAMSLTTRATIDSGRKDLEGRFTGAAVVWDLGVAGYIEAISADYSLTVRNLLDWQYDHPSSGQVEDARQRQPGLSLYADLSLRF